VVPDQLAGSCLCPRRVVHLDRGIITIADRRGSNARLVNATKSSRLSSSSSAGERHTRAVDLRNVRIHTRFTLEGPFYRRQARRMPMPSIGSRVPIVSNDWPRHGKAAVSFAPHLPTTLSSSRSSRSVPSCSCSASRSHHSSVFGKSSVSMSSHVSTVEARSSSYSLRTTISLDDRDEEAVARLAGRPSTSSTSSAEFRT
jgi:hypothetical protein